MLHISTMEFISTAITLVFAGFGIGVIAEYVVGSHGRKP